MTRPTIALALLAGCTPTPKAETATVTDSVTPPALLSAVPNVAAAYRCNDSTQIFALFRADSTGKAEVALAMGDERLYLPQLVSASGARYGDSVTTFWNKGDTVTFTRGDKQLTCRVEK